MSASLRLLARRGPQHGDGAGVVAEVAQQVGEAEPQLERFGVARHLLAQQRRGVGLAAALQHQVQQLVGHLPRVGYRGGEPAQHLLGAAGVAAAQVDAGERLQRVGIVRAQQQQLLERRRGLRRAPARSSPARASKVSAPERSTSGSAGARAIACRAWRAASSARPMRRATPASSRRA